MIKIASPCCSNRFCSRALEKESWKAVAFIRSTTMGVCMMVILANSKVSICSLNNVQAQHFSDSVKSHKNGASLGIKLSTTVSRSMAEDEIQHCQAQKDKIKYCSVLCVFSMPGILLCNGFPTFFFYLQYFALNQNSFFI